MEKEIVVPMKKKERVRLYKKKICSQDGRQCRASRVHRLKQAANKSTNGMKKLNSQINMLKRTVNKTTTQNKLLLRYS